MDAMLQIFDQNESNNNSHPLARLDEDSDVMMVEAWQTWMVEKCQRRTWRYWLERTAMALKHGPPTGLYNSDVRKRFNTMMEGCI
jgi:hypothetical protein